MELRFKIIAGPSLEKLLNPPEQYLPLFFLESQMVPEVLRGLFVEQENHLELKQSWAHLILQGCNILGMFEVKHPVFAQFYLNYNPKDEVNHGEIVLYIEETIPQALIPVTS